MASRRIVLCLYTMCQVYGITDDGQKENDDEPVLVKSHNYSEEMLYGDNRLLIEENGMWYAINPESTSLDKLIIRGDGRGGQMTYSARGMSKRWYVFYMPPARYIAYHNFLPIDYEFKRFKFLEDKVFMLCPSLQGYRQIVNHCVSKSGNYILIQNEEGRWFRMRNSSALPQELSESVLRLPSVELSSDLRRSHKRTHDRMLVTDAGIWYVRNRTLIDKIVAQGDGRGWMELLYVKGESGKWYTFENPPEDLLAYLSTCPVHYDNNQLQKLNALIELETRTDPTTSEKLYHEKQLIRTGTLWYVINELANRTLDRLVQKSEDGYGKPIVRGKSRRWYRFRNMSALFRIYVQRLPSKEHVYSVMEDTNGSFYVFHKKGFAHQLIKQDDPNQPYTINFRPMKIKQPSKPESSTNPLKGDKGKH